MAHPKAEAWLALKALKLAIDGEIDRLGTELREFSDDLGLRGGFDTRFGLVVENRREARISWDDDESLLAAWAGEHMPHEVVPGWVEMVEHPAAVRPSLYETLKDRIVIRDHKVVDPVTNTEIPGAHVTPPNSWWSTRIDAETKRQARAAVRDRVQVLVALVGNDPLAIGTEVTDG